MESEKSSIYSNENNMRAKVTVASTTEYPYGGKKSELHGVYSGSPEDNSFAKATPSLQMNITVDNPAVKDFLVPGKNYYLDFTPAP
jgi:hypothetical protein